jgi:TusA-related sulfurtransferase
MSEFNPNEQNKGDSNSLLPDDCLDLRGTPCPINFVRTKLRLEQMSPNALLEVWLDPGEPIEQVPDSLVIEGYKLEEIEEREGFFSLLIRRPVSFEKIGR